MAFSSPCFSVRFHCPMHGPHALASTLAPTSSSTSWSPSRSTVARMSSLPGVTMNGTLTLRPASRACLAIEATRDMSSYDELVHDPISPAVSAGDHLFSATNDENLDRGVDRSGVNGPFRWGSSSDRFCRARRKRCWEET